MKSRIVKCPVASVCDPEIQFAIQSVIEKEKEKWIKHGINLGVSVSVWTLTEPPYNKGRVATSRFQERIMEALDRLTKDYGEFVIDKIMSDLERLR